MIKAVAETCGRSVAAVGPLEHTATQEKISLLTEATFAITNMLAGVQARQAAR